MISSILDLPRGPCTRCRSFLAKSYQRKISFHVFLRSDRTAPQLTAELSTSDISRFVRCQCTRTIYTQQSSTRRDLRIVCENSALRLEEKGNFRRDKMQSFRRPAIRRTRNSVCIACIWCFLFSIWYELAVQPKLQRKKVEGTSQNWVTMKGRVRYTLEM